MLMNAMPFVIGTIAVFVNAYRFYFSFVAAKVAVRNDICRNHNYDVCISEY
jgi:carbon starvation protein CstA